MPAPLCRRLLTPPPANPARRDPPAGGAVVAGTVHEHGRGQVHVPVAQVLGPKAAGHLVGVAMREEQEQILALATRERLAGGLAAGGFGVARPHEPGLRL